MTTIKVLTSDDTSPLGEGTFAFTGSISSDPVLLHCFKGFGVSCTMSGSGGVAPVGLFQVSGSVDGVSYFGLGTAQAFTNLTTLFQNFDAISTKYVKAVVTRTTGSAGSTAKLDISVI